MLAPGDLQFFLAIAASPSLAAAARTLDVSPSAVTQRLRALELRLGLQLVDRSGHHLSLTAEGDLIAERGRDIVTALNGLNDTLAEWRGEVAGHLRVIAPLGFGRRYIAPLVARFQADHPQLRIDFVLTDRPTRTQIETGGLVIHIGDQSEAPSNLIVRKLAQNARFICASPAYLARNGMPKNPKDLLAHSCIALRENEEDVTLWRFHRIRDKLVESIRIDPFLASNDGEVVKAWAIAGYGLIVRSEWDVAGDLLEGRLVRVLTDYDLPPAPIVALIGARREARSARTTRFLEMLADSLRQPPWY
jgi:DNA-binding transcriptional LysR family regulator